MMKKRTMKKWALSFMALLLMTAPALAQEEVTAEDVPDDAEVYVLDNPYKGRIEEQARLLADSFSEEEMQNFSLVNQGFGFVRSIAVARSSIEGAVKKCSRKNPDMEDAMTESFDEWKAAVNPVLEEQEKNLGYYVSDDYFDDPDAIEKYFDLLDQAADQADKNIDKQIVSNPDACERLRQSMGDTSATIVKHLSGVEWPDQTLEQARGDAE